MAHKVSDEVLLFVGVVVLAMCICFDVFKAYNRGAKWLPGSAVAIYALCLQLIGYLDVQNVSIAGTHKDDQLEVLLSNQLSIDTSRLVLFVFVGYLLPDLVSTQGFWTIIAALFTSLSTHIAIDLSVALHSRVNDKDKVVKGQSGIWLIASDFVLLESFFLFLYAISWAISCGRIIRDNLGSRIPLALESPETNNEAVSLGTYQSEMLKSWIVARVSQPEYVLNRSPYFCLAVACVVTFNVVFMGLKVIFLRSHLQGPSQLFTIQCIFIVVGWFVVFYRFLISSPFFSTPQHGRSHSFSGPSITPYISTIRVLYNKIENSVFRSVVILGVSLFRISLFCIYVLGMMVGSAMFLVSLLLVLVLIVCPGSCMFVLIRRFCLAPPEDEDEDFPTYREALERVCMPGDDAKSLWAANKSSFAHMRKCIDKGYEIGKSCGKLQKVIGSRLAQNIPSSEDVKELLEPLESVRMYFPLLKDSFRKITALVLLMDDYVSEDKLSMRKLKGDVRAAFEEAEEVMDFLDCPDNVGISLDFFNISNLEAFMLTDDSIREFRQVRFNFRESPTVDNAIEKLFNEAKNKLVKCNLLEDVNSQAVGTEWDKAAEAYAKYKVCKLILDHPAESESVEKLQRYLINMAAYLISMCVTESPKIMVECSRKWAAEFREDKICASIGLFGFACGVTDGAREQHRQLPV